MQSERSICGSTMNMCRSQLLVLEEDDDPDSVLLLQRVKTGPPPIPTVDAVKSSSQTGVAFGGATADFLTYLLVIDDCCCCCTVDPVECF